MATKEICSNCGYVGQAKKVTKGSTLMELVLWLCFIFPGLIYSMWRLTTKHLACPKCGATDPGHKISRQQRNAISTTIQLVVIAILLIWGGTHLWRTVVPMAKELLGKPQTEQTR